MNALLDPLVYLECLKIVAERDNLAQSELHPIMINEVLAVEDELGIPLPEQYEDFLMKAGAGTEYGGLATWYHFDLTLTGNLLEKNVEIQHRRRGEKPPGDFLAVYDPCDGSLIGYQAQNGSYSTELFIWSKEDGIESLSDDLYSFLAENIDCDGAELEEAERRALPSATGTVIN